nr:hypothetical protein [Halorussus sp. MSC15.2]
MSVFRESLAETAAHEVALNCLEAGIEGAHRPGSSARASPSTANS